MFFNWNVIDYEYLKFMTTTTVFGQSNLENKMRNDLHPDLHHTMSQSFLTDWEYSILNIQMSIYTGFILQCNNVTIDGASMLISKFMWLSIKLVLHLPMKWFGLLVLHLTVMLPFYHSQFPKLFSVLFLEMAVKDEDFLNEFWPYLIIFFLGFFFHESWKFLVNLKAI